MKNMLRAGITSRLTIAILLALLFLVSCNQPLEEWEWIDEAGPLGKAFKIYYDGNGSTSGTLPAASGWHLPGEQEWIYSPNNLAKAGCFFAGWNSAADGSGSSYAHSTFLTMPSFSITMYAQWFYTGTITTIAGTSGGGSGGDGGLATAAQLFYPYDVALGPDGSLFIADLNNHKIRKVDTSGIISTVAGTGSSGFSGDGGPAVDAMLNRPGGIAVDASGAIFIADMYNNRIRRIDSGGTITTVAGTGTVGSAGDGGPAISAMLNYPADVALDSAGSIYIADHYNNRVRKIVSGTITTIAGTGTPGNSGDGGPAVAANLNGPSQLAVDTAGSLYFGCDNRIRKVTDGLITSVAGGGNNSSYGLPATGAYLYTVKGVAVDGAGRIFFTQSNASIIYVVEPNGFLTAAAGSYYPGISGDGGPASAARLYYPNGLALDSSGNLFIADTQNNRIRKITY